MSTSGVAFWVELTGSISPQADKDAVYATLANNAAAGLKYAVVQVDARYESFLEDDLRARIPAGLTVTPGLKTSPACGHTINNTSGWSEVASRSAAVAATWGNTECLLENESTVGPYQNGTETPDWTAFDAGIDALAATGLVYWWYPTLITTEPGDIYNRCMTLLTHLVARLPSVRLVNHFAHTTPASQGGFELHHSGWDATNALSALSNQPQVDQLFYGTSGWPLADMAKVSTTYSTTEPRLWYPYGATITAGSAAYLSQVGSARTFGGLGASAGQRFSGLAPKSR